VRDGLPGTGREAMSRRTLTLRPRNADAGVARSICPYCGVGCGQLVFHRDGTIVNIEGDPASLAGSLITRFAWLEAGAQSAADPRVPLALGPSPSTAVADRRVDRPPVP
jgi:molybdopterin-dependent oxidoreductase iron-sulfur protein